MMKNDKFYIPISKPSLIGKEKDYVLDCLDSTWISSNGRYIGLFEIFFSEYIGVRHAISCSNGTVALHLALLALGIGPGDEVIVPTLTFVATANAVRYTGAIPVFIGSESDTWNLRPDMIESLITSRTKAIIPVPLYGHPCDMDPIIDIARKNNLFVIEDAAQALGSEYKNKKCGGIADISTFSFYGNKIITTGEGGMVVTDNDEWAEKVRRLKGQGMNPLKRYWFDIMGYNYRMTNIQAAIGLAQMENIDELISKRRQIAQWYTNLLKNICGITFPVEKEYAMHSYWLYSILIENNFGKSRDELATFLAENNIETRPFFYPMHILPEYENRSLKHLKNTEIIARKGINLPTYYDLRFDDVKTISKFIRTQSCS